MLADEEEARILNEQKGRQKGLLPCVVDDESLLKVKDTFHV